MVRQARIMPCGSAALKCVRLDTLFILPADPNRERFYSTLEGMSYLLLTHRTRSWSPPYKKAGHDGGKDKKLSDN